MWRAARMCVPDVLRMYGWFTGLLCCGSCIGAAAWAAFMQSRESLFVAYKLVPADPTFTNAAIFDMFARAARWQAALDLLSPAEFLCLSVAKLLVLYRMLDFAAPRDEQGVGISRRWLLARRAALSTVVAGNAIGLAGNAVAAVYHSLDAHHFDATVAAITSGAGLLDILAELILATDTLNTANQWASVQEFCEVLVLLLIIAQFAVAGVMCARRISSVLRGMPGSGGGGHAGWSARRLRLQIVATVAVAFVTFLLRAVFSTMYALSNALQNNNMIFESAGKICSVNFCDLDCFNACVCARLLQQRRAVTDVTDSFMQVRPNAVLDHLYPRVPRHSHHYILSPHAGSGAMGHDGRACTAADGVQQCSGACAGGVVARAAIASALELS